MAENGKHGQDWDTEELDLIVSDYFSMLIASTTGQPLVKAHHARELASQIGRTVGSVGQKYGNISSVLTELGMPKLDGFGRRPNYQGAIFLAIERYLDANPRAWEIGLPHDNNSSMIPSSTVGVEEYDVLYTPDWPQALNVTPPPGLKANQTRRPEGLTRLVRKFDPAARDHRNRQLGKLGEERVLQHEKAFLIASDRHDLAQKVEWTSQEIGDGAGYDIRSFNPHDGSERLIEVKSTRGGASTDFFLTRTEHEVSLERPEAWRLYRVHSLPTKPGLFILPPPLAASVKLSPESWRAWF